MESIYSLKTNDILSLHQSLGLKPSLASTTEILNNIYRYPNKAFKFKPHIPPKLVEFLSNSFSHQLPNILKQQTASDGTVKFLIETRPGKSVETVLLPFRKSYTLCVSSQVGCAMNCSFCHTATQGLKGQLKPEQIIQQYMVAKSQLNDPRPITNMVFMGQGEPLHNFENLKQAIDILTDPNGISMSRQKITVSTSGFLPGIERFDELGGVNFALSLHSVDEKTRSKLIPLNKKYPLELIDQEIQKITLKEKQYIEYEYLLIRDLNDSISDAEQLAKFIIGKKAILNIIPFNEFAGSNYKRPLESTIKDFTKKMASLGVRTMLRGTKGDDIMAACGQLKS